MPRIGCYVPDALWYEAKRRFPGQGPSGIVQAALRIMIDEVPAVDEGTDAFMDQARRGSAGRRLVEGGRPPWESPGYGNR